MGGRIIGIDLGMTSIVAAYIPGPGLSPRVIPTEHADPSFPAVVGFTPEGRHRLGRAALAMLTTAPQRAVFGMKRLVGRSLASIAVRDLAARSSFQIVPGASGTASVVIGTRTLPVPEVLGFLLSSIREYAEAHLGEEVSRAVFTVPAYFKPEQKAGIEEAAALAGFEIARFFSEPTAVALAYRFNAIRKAKLAILDMGGVRFDATILQISGPVFDVLGAGGAAYLGGSDLDSALTDHILARILEASGRDLTEDPRLLRRVRACAELAKKKVALEGNADVKIPLSSGSRHKKFATHVQLDAHLLEKLSEGLAGRAIAETRATLNAVNLKPQDIDAVLLAGGCMRLPFIRRAFERFFQRELLGNFPPEQVTALGAALMAHSYERTTVSETIH